MPRVKTVSECVDVAVGPAAVYAAVSDPTQTGRWSPENTGARVTGRPGPLAVGDEFVGSNQRFGFRWVTRCRVTVAEPGQRFQFAVEAIGVRQPRLRVPIATWTYDLVPLDGGTRVIETWDDDRRTRSETVTNVFDKLVTRTTFAKHNRRNMRVTLDNLKRELES